MKVVVFMIVLAATAAWAGEEIPAGYVQQGYQQQSATQWAPVVHDATGRTTSQWSALEWRFYNGARGSRSQGEILEMFNASPSVIHPPLCSRHEKEVVGCRSCRGATYCEYHRRTLDGCSRCGIYTPDMDRHINSVYQAWTGPAKVKIPVSAPAPTPYCPPPVYVPPAPPAPMVNNNYNVSYSFGSSATPAYQVGGAYGPTIATAQTGFITFTPGVRINNLNSQTQQQQQNQQNQQQQGVSLTP